MLKLFGNNSSSIQVEQIEKLDFSQLYENVATVYDFFDAEVSRTGNMEEVEKILQTKLEKYEIYKDGFIKLNIDHIFIKNEKISVVVCFDTDIENSYMIKFGVGYTDKYFDEENGFYTITKQLSVGEIKEEIEKRWDLFRVATQFEKNEYKFQDAIKMEEGQYLYKELYIGYSGIMARFSDKKKESYYNKLQYYFDFLRNLLDKTYKLEIVSENCFSVTDVDGEKFNILIYTNSNITVSGVYLGIINMSLGKAEEIYEILDENINHINETLEEKEKVSKLVKGTKYNLWSSLHLDSNSISENIEQLMRKYHRLKEKGDSFSAIACGFLFNIKTDIIDIGGGESEVDYDIEEYNRLLDSVIKEDVDSIVDYYKRKIIRLNKLGDKGEILQVLMKLIEIPDSKRINIFTDMGDLDDILTRSYIEMIMDSLSDDNRGVFINQIYIKFLKKDLTSVTTNLEKYKDIHKYPVMEHVLDQFYDLLVKAIVFTYLNIESRGTILKPLGEALNKLDMSDYVENIEDFEEKYQDLMYYEFYKEIIQRDSIFIDFLTEESFETYAKLDEYNIDNFIENVLIPYLLLVLHKMDRQSVTKHIELLDQGCMIEVLDDLEYPEVVKNIVFQSRNENKHCKEVLFYWGILERLPVLSSYNKNSIEIDIKDEIEGILEKNLNLKINSFTEEIEENIFDMSLERKIARFVDLLIVKDDKTIQTGLVLLGKNFILHMLDYASVDMKKKFAILEGLPTDVYVKLAKDKNDEVVLALLGGQTLLKSPIGEIIAKHPSKKVRSLFIEKYKLSEDTQKIICISEEGMMQLMNSQKTLKGGIAGEIAKYGTDKVKMRLIEYSTKLHQDTQRTLLQDKNENIVLALLGSQKSIYDKSAIWIANNGSDKIKKRFIEKYKIIGKIQKILAKDSERIVLYMLNTQKKLRDGAGDIVAMHPSIKVKRKLAKWYLDESIALKLATNEEDEELLLNLLYDKKIYYTSVLLELAKKDSEKIGRRLVNGFKNLDSSILSKLVMHPSIKVKRRLAKWNLNENDALKLARKEKNEELLLNLISDGKGNYYTSVILEIIRKGSRNLGLVIVSEFTKLPGEIIEELLKHSSKEVQQEAVKRFNL